MTATSKYVNSRTNLSPRFESSGLLGESNGLLVMILRGLFCNFDSLSNSVPPQQPQTEEQHLYGAALCKHIGFLKILWKKALNMFQKANRMRNRLFDRINMFFPS